MAASKLELTPRLQLLADWVPQGSRLADVGTDHAYLPTWLALHGRVLSAIASDLRKGPLSRGQETIAEYGVEGLVETRLCSGLSGICANEVDTVVIAGMGGENIVSILEAAPWTADGAHCLLLQPMTRAEVLREFLALHGYEIQREQLVWDRGTIYPVMLVWGGEMQLSLGQLYGGRLLTHDPLQDRYLIEKIIRLQMAVTGSSHSRKLEEQQKADTYREIITQLMQMREEWRHANDT